MRALSPAFLKIFALFLAAVALASCQPSAQSAERTGVAASVLPQADFIEAVGGDRVETLVMVPPGANPHTYEPKPAELAALSEVKMYAQVGSGLEFELAWMDKLIAVNRGMLVVDCSEGISLEKENGAAIDPHIWMSPANAQRMVRSIAGGLARIDPDSRPRYEQAADSYISKLVALDGEIRERLSGVANRKFIVYHPVMGYFAREYDLEQIAIEEEGKEPTATRIAEVIELARQNKIDTIFATPQFNPRSAEIVASSIGGRVVLIDPLARDYIENMRDVMDKLATAMERGQG